MVNKKSNRREETKRLMKIHKQMLEDIIKSDRYNAFTKSEAREELKQLKAILKAK